MLNINKPTLILDEEKAKRNIAKMAAKAVRHDLVFRPHLKTPQSAEISKWYREAGVKKITVSSVQMAKYFAENGWGDITIAFPINILEIEDINYLASRCQLNILIENIEAISFLKDNLKNEVGFYIKIDSGAHRTGIDPKNKSLITSIIDHSDESIKFQGFLTHAGHTYSVSDLDELNQYHERQLKIMGRLKSGFSAHNPVISVGDTPTCSLSENFNDVDEIRPGNFIFYDLMQYQIGACEIGDISVCMVCPLVAKHPSRNEMVIYGGAVHFSKEHLIEEGKLHYGIAVRLENKGWAGLIDNVRLIRLSQEHGILHAPTDFINKTQIGDLIGILPVHSCLTANLMGKFLTLGGDFIYQMDENILQIS